MTSVQVAQQPDQNDSEGAVAPGTDDEDSSQQGLSKLQMLRNQFRSKIVEEKERKLNLLNNKKQNVNLGKPNRKVTINGYVQEFSPDTNKTERAEPRTEKDGNVYKESLKSPGLGQRMQTDLAKFGASAPSQKELELRRRQAILDSLHKKETEKKKTDTGYSPFKPKTNSKMGYKGHLPPIPGSVKKSHSKTEMEDASNNNTEVKKADNSNETGDVSESENNPFMSKPAMIKRKALPGVKKQVYLAPPGGVTSEESELTSDHNTSDKENTQISQLSHRNTSQIQPIPESENTNQERQPLRESHSSNNDSAGNRTLVLSSRSNDMNNVNNPTNHIEPLEPPRRNNLTSSHSQRPRSVTAREVIEMTSNANFSNPESLTSDLTLDSNMPVSSPKGTQNVVISDTITDLESGLQIESYERQRLDALQRLNKRTNEERVKSAKRLVNNLTDEREDQSNSELLLEASEPTDLNLLGRDSKKNEDGKSDTEISGKAVVLNDRKDAPASVRRSESHRLNYKKGLSSGIAANAGEVTNSLGKIPGVSARGEPSTLTGQSAGTGDVKETISVMRKREKDLIEAIRKQQEELEHVRKQRYRQERIFKSSVHRKTEKNRSESESSRILSTEEASQSELTHSNSTGNEWPSKKRAPKVRLPPKKSLEIKEDPYYAQIAEKSTPLSIDMQKCQYCSRSFAPDRLAKHMDICQNLQGKKRLEYDTPKHRLQGTGAENFQQEEPSNQIYSTGSFQSTASHQSGSSSHPTSHQMVKCPTCGKHYPFHSAERHIPVCRKNRQEKADAQVEREQNGRSSAVQNNVYIGRV